MFSFSLLSEISFWNLPCWLQQLAWLVHCTAGVPEPEDWSKNLALSTCLVQRGCGPECHADGENGEAQEDKEKKRLKPLDAESGGDWIWGSKNEGCIAIMLISPAGWETRENGDCFVETLIQQSLDTMLCTLDIVLFNKDGPITRNPEKARS